MLKKILKKRQEKNKKIYEQVKKLVKDLKANINGDENIYLEIVLISLCQMLMQKLLKSHHKRFISVSNGSACTSFTYEPSHVIKAMNNDENIIKGAVRISWCHLTDDKIPIEEIFKKITKYHVMKYELEFQKIIQRKRNFKTSPCNKKRKY